MDLLAVLLALSPVIVIFLLLTLRRTAADVAASSGGSSPSLSPGSTFRRRSPSPCGPAWWNSGLAADRLGGRHLDLSGDRHA